MNKLKEYILIAIAALAFMLITGIAKSEASDYNTAVVGHVIQSKVNGDNVDLSVLEAELAKIAHTYAFEMVSVLEKHLPSILDALSAELRAKSDLAYKCSLQSETIKEKNCK